MKFYERFSSVFRRVPSRKSVTKLLMTGTATMALTAGLWVFTAMEDRLLQVEPEMITSPATVEQAPEPAPRGLSRQREDFDKALSIIAEAASTNNYLMDYFARVQKRVRGEETPPEQGSGVRVIKPASKSPQKIGVDRLSAADASGAALGQAGAKKALSRLKGFVAGPMKESPAPPASSWTPVEARRDSLTGATGLTVGDLKFEMNPAIERWVNYYTTTLRGRQTMQIGINRSSSYIELARAEFRRLGIPEDLVWLAHVESVWHTEAVSPAAAGGLWQFIPRTAKDYGLTVSQEYDERLDPAKQTQVAATYLRDLYTIFGDWALAMAAYNCGEPRVMDAIVKNGRADFWELHRKQLLPKETLNYVPKILAAIEVASRAEAYGFLPGYQDEVVLAD